MSWFQSPGKQGAAPSTTASQQQAPQQAPQPAVGKQTQVQAQTLAQPAAAVASGSNAKKGTLNEHDRHKYEELVGGDILEAHIAYLSALGSLELDEKIKKEEDLPLWANLLLSAGGDVLKIAFGAAVRAMRVETKMLRELAQAGAETEARKVIAELQEQGLNSVVRLSIDTGKKSVEVAAKKAMHGDAKATAVGHRGAVKNAIQGDAKAAAVGYILRLKDASMFMFRAMREKVGDMDDAALVAAHEALKPENILPSMFVDELRAKIDRFMTSGIREVGMRDDNNNTGFVLERKVGWVFDESGRRLCYIDDAITGEPSSHPGGAYTSIPKLSLAQESNWTGDAVPNTDNEHRYPQLRGHAELAQVRMVGTVPEEFWTEAEDQHKAQWVTSPMNYRVVKLPTPHLELL